MSFAPQPSSRVRLLGQAVDLVTKETVMRFTAETVARGGRGLVANHNLHSLHLVRRDPAMRRFYALADLIELDSMPLVAWGRLLGLPVRGEHRCTYLDWRDDFWREAKARGWRVFYLGGAPGVAEAAARRVRADFPGVEIAVRHGYFDQSRDSADTAGILAEIEAFGADVLFVGMGMPIQERWIVDAWDRLGRGVVFSVGAAFDYEAGVQKAAPRWMGRAGLEWLFRLCADPRRLATRYLVEPWSLAGPALQDLARAATARRRAPRPATV